MKALLLNNGGYCGLEEVEFPVEVHATEHVHGVNVSVKELVRVGARQGPLGEEHETWFFLPSEYEEVESGN